MKHKLHMIAFQFDEKTRCECYSTSKKIYSIQPGLNNAVLKEIVRQLNWHPVSFKYEQEYSDPNREIFYDITEWIEANCNGHVVFSPLATKWCFEQQADAVAFKLMFL